jgi:hypothetical protein
MTILWPILIWQQAKNPWCCGIAGALAEFDTYLKTVIDHDPGVKKNIMFFGRQGDIERALDIFYGI